MPLLETWLKCELTEPIKVHYLKGNVFSMDSLGNRIGVSVYKEGQPFTLSGSAQGYCVLASGATVPVAGVRSDNYVYIDLIQDCYAVPGPISIVIKLTDGDTITTLACIVANVYLSRTDQMITPGQSIIDDWTEEITAVLQQCIDATVGTVKYSESQSLTDSQKALARTNISVPSEQDLSDAVAGMVKYTAQSLTDAQKEQARTNISAASEEEYTELNNIVTQTLNSLFDGGWRATTGEIVNKWYNGSELVSDTTHGYSCTHITNTKGLLHIDFTSASGANKVWVIRNNVSTGYGQGEGTFSVDVEGADEIYINFFGSDYVPYFDIYTKIAVDPQELLDIKNGYEVLTTGEIKGKYYDGTQLVSNTNYSCTHLTNFSEFKLIQYYSLARSVKQVWVVKDGVSYGYGDAIAEFLVDITTADEVYINFFGSSNVTEFKLYYKVSEDPKTIGDLMNGYTSLVTGEIKKQYYDGTQLVSNTNYSCTHLTDLTGYKMIQFSPLVRSVKQVWIIKDSVSYGYGDAVKEFLVDISYADEVYINFFGASNVPEFKLYYDSSADPKTITDLENGYSVLDTGEIKNKWYNGTGYQTDTTHGYSCTHITNLNGISHINFTELAQAGVKMVWVVRGGVATGYGGKITDYSVNVIGADEVYINFFGTNYVQKFYVCFGSAMSNSFEGNAGLNFFTVTVDNSDPGSGTSSTQSQSNLNLVNINAVIELPENYTTCGDPVPCVMICHGAGFGVSASEWGYFMSDGSYGDSTAFNALKAAFINNGLAIMDINGSENTLPFQSWGVRRTVDAYRKLYEYCVTHFNIKEHIGVYGFSMGGIVSLNFCYMNRDIVSHLALGCPTISLHGTYAYKQAFRIGIAAAYQFTGTAPTWSDQYTQAEEDYYQSNIALTYGQDPYKRSFDIGNDKYMFPLPPMRIWYGATDDGVDYQGVLDFITAVRNAGGEISLRMVDGQGHRVCYGGVAVVNSEISQWLNRVL